MYRSKEINKAIKNFKQGDAQWRDVGDVFQNSLFNVSAVSQLVKELELEQSMNLGILIGAYTGKVRDSRSNDILWTRNSLKSVLWQHQDLLNKCPPWVDAFKFEQDGRKFNLDINDRAVVVREIDGSFVSKTEFGSFCEALNEYFGVVDQVSAQTFDFKKYAIKKISLEDKIKQADAVRDQAADTVPVKQAEKER